MTDYHQFVSKFYQMDPDTEDIASSGYDLCDGMIVLIEAMHMREHNDEDRVKAGYEGERDPYSQDRLIKSNRWCLVTRYQQYREHDQIAFVGVYADGTKAAFRYGDSHEWFFKLNCTRTDALIVSEQEWEEMNYRGAEDGTKAEPQQDEEVVECEGPYDTVKFDPIFRVQIHYDMFGDDSGEEWFNTVGDWHKKNGDIVDYQFLDSQTGAWGFKSVVGTFDIQLGDERETWEGAKSLAHDVIMKMIGESDFTILGMGVTNFPA